MLEFDLRFMNDIGNAVVHGGHRDLNTVAHKFDNDHFADGPSFGRILKDDCNASPHP